MNCMERRRKRSERIVDISHAYIKALGLTGGQARGSLKFYQQEGEDMPVLDTVFERLAYKEIFINLVFHPDVDLGDAEEAMAKVLKDLGYQKNESTGRYAMKGEKKPMFFVGVIINVRSFEITAHWYPHGLKR